MPGCRVNLPVLIAQQTVCTADAGHLAAGVRSMNCGRDTAQHGRAIREHGKPLAGSAALGGAWGLLSFVAFNNRLGKNPQAEHGIAQHQDQHGILAAQGYSTLTQGPHGHQMRQIDGNDMARHNGQHHGIPPEPCAYNLSVDVVLRRPQQIPPKAKGV